MKTLVLFWYLTEFFLQWEMFQAKFVERNTTHVLCSISSFSENCAIYEIIWKNIEQPGRQATDDIIMNVAHMLCMLDNWGKNTGMCAHTHTHPLIIFNTNCFYTATMVMQECLKVTLYIHCLSACLLGCGQCRFKSCAEVRQLLGSLFCNRVNVLCVHVCVCVCVCLFVCACLHMCMCLCMHAYMCVRMHVCVCVCVCVFIPWFSISYQ